MTPAETLALLQSRFDVAATGTWPTLGVVIARDRWIELARTAKDELGCRFFAFSMRTLPLGVAYAVWTGIG